MGYWVILSISGFFTILSLLSTKFESPFRYSKAFVYFITGVCWLTMIFYHVSNPPSTITVGSTVHQFLIYIYAGMSLLLFIGGVMSGVGEFKGSKPAKQKRVQDYTPEEYRAYVRPVRRPSRRR